MARVITLVLLGCLFLAGMDVGLMQTPHSQQEGVITSVHATTAHAMIVADGAEENLELDPEFPSAIELVSTRSPRPDASANAALQVKTSLPQPLADDVYLTVRRLLI